MSSVWNFCARYSDVVLRGLKWRPRETSAVFSGYTLGRRLSKFFVFCLNRFGVTEPYLYPTFKNDAFLRKQGTQSFSAILKENQLRPSS